MTWRQSVLFQDSSFPTNALESIFLHEVVWMTGLIGQKYTRWNWYLSPLLYSFGGLERFLLVRVESKKVGKLHLWEAEKVEPTVVLSLLRLPNLWLLLLCIIPTTCIFLSLSL